MLLGPWAGVVADRADKRRMILIAQAVLGSCALLLGILVLTDIIHMWMIYTIVLVPVRPRPSKSPHAEAFWVSWSRVMTWRTPSASTALWRRRRGPAGRHSQAW